MRPDRYRDDIRAELELIARELSQFEPLLRKVRLVTPDRIEINALAMLLHSFYCGVENIFKRIVSNIDQTKLTATRWHQDLLNLMAQAVPQRPAVISPDFHTTLQQYLGFRHISRNVYSSQLDWELMRNLVDNLGTVHARFRDEINAFLAELERRPQ